MTTSLRRGFCLQWQRTILCECALLRYYGFIVSSLLIEVVVLQRLNPGPVVLLVQAKPGVGVWVGEGERGTTPVPASFPVDLPPSRGQGTGQ